MFGMPAALFGTALFGTIADSLEVGVGNYPCGGIATAASNGCRDNQKCCWINEYSGWCSDTGTGTCSGYWCDKSSGCPTFSESLQLEPVEHTVSQSHANRSVKQVSEASLEVDVGNYPCGGIATAASNGCRDNQKCCWINEYSGWCSDTGTGTCSGYWCDKSSGCPTFSESLQLERVEHTVSQSHANRSVKQVSEASLEVDVGNYPCGGIATAASNGCRDDQKCCWINEYSGWCSDTGTGTCSGYWCDKNSGCPTLESLQSESTDDCDAITQCTDYSLKSCVEKHPTCVDQCIKVCPDRCSGCACGQACGSAWVCDACLSECECDHRDACCPSGIMPAFMA